MKVQVIASILFLALLMAACNNEKPASSAEELAKMRQEMEEKKKELSDKQQIAELEAEMKKLDAELDKVGRPAKSATPEQRPTEPAAIQTGQPAASNEPRGTINGTGVVLRKESSVKSDKLGNFKPNEVVTVLESRNVNNDNEAILTKTIALYTTSTGSGEVALQLPKGKAVVLENYDADKNKHYVSYQDPAKGKLYAYINSDAIETISFSTWYRVKRSNGQEGWVLGKFLKV